jgi:hypothetical protein
VLQSAVFVANGREVRRADAKAPAIPFPGGPKAVAPSAAGVLSVDWNNDYRPDLLLAGAGGLRFWEQQPDGSFVDVTEKTTLAKSALPDKVLEGDYFGAWAADIDMDGDLDIIVACRTGAPLLLRNNGDGTFKARDFVPVKDVRAFAWADLDNGGAPDAVFLDAAGKLHVFANDRAGQFSPWPLPENLGTFLAVTAADVNDDGVFDLVALRSDGTIVRISDQGKRKSWQIAELASWPGPRDAAPGTVALYAEDLDNNGALDLVVAGPREAHIFLADEQRKFERLPAAVPVQVFAVVDLNRDGRLNLLGLSDKGQPVRALNQGRKNYHWQVLWLFANTHPGGAISASTPSPSAARWRSAPGRWCRNSRSTPPSSTSASANRRRRTSPASSGPTGSPSWSSRHSCPPRAASKRPSASPAPARSCSPTTAPGCTSAAISCGAPLWACTSTARISATSRRPLSG